MTRLLPTHPQHSHTLSHTHVQPLRNSLIQHTCLPFIPRTLPNFSSLYRFPTCYFLFLDCIYLLFSFFFFFTLIPVPPSNINLNLPFSEIFSSVQFSSVTQSCPTLCLHRAPNLNQPVFFFHSPLFFSILRLTMCYYILIFYCL